MFVISSLQDQSLKEKDKTSHLKELLTYFKAGLDLIAIQVSFHYLLQTIVVLVDIQYHLLLFLISHSLFKFLTQ